MTGWSQDRRSFLLGGTVALATPGALLARPSLRTAAPVIIETADGKLRGLRQNGIARFRGVPYAADTSGHNRFMAPRGVAKWAGVRDAIIFGERAPQGTGPAQPQADGGAPRYGENCCVLNIHTPRIDRRAALPVLVFVHGGGFRSGAGDAPIMDGSRLAGFGKVVVVTLNRRLNVLGFANLGQFDPDFIDAANAGQLDLIAALRWLRTNVAGFGGDPGRIMIFGHSGGGSAVEALSIMPGAEGLFHCTGNLSGSSAFAMNTAAELVPATELFLRNLSVTKGDLRKLQQLPPEQLLAAHNAAFRTLGKGDFRPVVDGLHIPDAPLTPRALERATRLPTIMNCTSTEASAWLAQDRRNIGVNIEAVRRRIARQFGIDEAAAKSVTEAYQAQDSGRTPWDVLVAAASDALVRKPMRLAAEAKAALGKSPVHLGEFAWKSPNDGGIWGGPHGSEVAFAFGNADRNPLSAGAAPAAAQAIADASRNFMSALVALAGTRSPANRAMPPWQAYNLSTRPTMVIDSRCELAADYRSADRTASGLLPSQDAFGLISGPLFRFDA